MQKNILISKKTAKKIIAARQKAIQKEKAEKYWEKANPEKKENEVKRATLAKKEKKATLERPAKTA